MSVQFLEAALSITIFSIIGFTHYVFVALKQYNTKLVKVMRVFLLLVECILFVFNVCLTYYMFNV